MKKIIQAPLVVIPCFFSVIVAAEATPHDIPAPDVPAEHYIVIDSETNTIIAEKGADDELRIASLTKLMTAYVVFKEIENGTLSLDDKVNVSVKAWKTSGSRMFIEEGSKVSVRELLNGLLVVSGNDAAVALSEHIAGSEGRFAELMNAYAKKLGMEHSVFANVTGLPQNTEMHSSARDLSILANAIIKEYPEYYKLFSQKEFVYNNITQKNRNALLHESSNYDGLKTGYTIRARYCLASSFNKDGRRLITIILGADSPAERFMVAKTLTNYAFRRFQNVQPVNKQVAVHKIPVYYGEQDFIPVYPSKDYVMTIPRGLVNNESEKDIKLTAFFDSNGDEKAVLFAPVKELYQVGRLEVAYKGEVVESIPLITKQTVDEGGWGEKLKDWVELYTSKIIK